MEEKEDYPEEFDSRGFLELIKERFGSPIIGEEELLLRFTNFIAPRQPKELSDEDITTWYKELVLQVEQLRKPLDTATIDISNPHAGRRPTLEKRMQEQGREISMASRMLAQKQSRKVEKKKPIAPMMED